MTKLSKLFFYFLVTFLLSCTNSNYFPKPYGYFRVDLPENNYVLLDTILPYSFDLSTSAVIDINKDNNWINIIYPDLNASIYCSYVRVDSAINKYSEDSRRAVYKHLVKADNIEEKVFENPEKKVHGIFYNLHGNVASTAQFVLTDSTNHFFRGAVYFNNIPNKDSIAPMADFIKRDVIRLMESFSWK